MIGKFILRDNNRFNHGKQYESVIILTVRSLRVDFR